MASTAEISPLDVMLAAMRELWAHAESLKGKPRATEERLALIRQASAEAHKAAVYLHPRLASVDSAEEEGGGRPMRSAATATESRPPLGTRELARRLLFAVALAEELTGAGQSPRPSAISDKERS